MFGVDTAESEERIRRGDPGCLYVSPGPLVFLPRKADLVCDDAVNPNRRSGKAKKANCVLM